MNYNIIREAGIKAESKKKHPQAKENRKSNVSSLIFIEIYINFITLELRRDLIQRSFGESEIPSYYELHGIFDWMKLLKKVSDNDLKAICGTDAALYLVFLRYSAKFFMCVTIASILIVIPVYLSGEP